MLGAAPGYCVGLITAASRAVLACVSTHERTHWRRGVWPASRSWRRPVSGLYALSPLPYPFLTTFW